MSHATDATAEAIALHKRLAASRLVRRDEIDAELAATSDEGRRAALAAERAAVESELQAALAEIRELQRLARQAPEPTLSREELAADDALPQSAEFEALENAREHIRSLEAEVRVNDELRKLDTPDPDEPAPPTSPGGPRKRTM